MNNKQQKDRFKLQTEKEYSIMYQYERQYILEEVNALRVADVIVKALENEGITTVFGYPGAAICPFFDALADSEIKTVLMRNEQAAGHAANGFARMTNAPAVCAATSGPGALNLITAIATAYMDSVPLIAITGQVASGLIGRDVFQEADITGAAEPFVKHSYLVKNPESFPKIIKEAFFIAGTGRKGPVIIDIPIDVFQAEINPDFSDNPIEIRGYLPCKKTNYKKIEAAAQAFKESARPLICVGGGVFSSGCEKEIAAFAKDKNIPIVSTLMGLSAISPQEKLYRGMIGMYGSFKANNEMKNADLILLAGARVGDRAIMSPMGLKKNAKLIHIDIDPAELGKNVETDIRLTGDVGKVISKLSGQLGNIRFEGREPAENPTRRHSKKTINPADFMELLCRYAEKDSVILADVGQHQLWAARGYNIENGRFLSSGGMGTMGYAIPAAIGAKLAAQNRQMIVICGDGGFQMSMAELAVIKAQKLDVKIVIMNNRGLGMIRELQSREYGSKFTAVDLDGDPSFALLCRAYDVPAARVEKPELLESEIKKMLNSEGCYLLECMIDKKETAL